MKFKRKNGFTLIELLVVIAILGIIMAAVVAGIDPVDKIRVANDAKVQADIGAIGTAIEAYAASNAGVYPVAASAMSDMVTSGDLKVTVVPPSTDCASYVFTAAGTNLVVSCNVHAKKFGAACPSGNTCFWNYCTSTGRADDNSTSATTCP